MPKATNDSDSESPAPSESKAVKGTTVAEIARLIISTFTIFVGFSIFLGRIYHGKYLETLGIPETDVHIAAINYAVISPDVTIAALGIASAVVGILWWSVWNREVFRFSGKKLFWGILFYFAGLMGAGFSLTWGVILTEGLGLLGIFWAASFLSYTFGWVLIWPSIGSLTASGYKRTSNLSRAARRRIRKEAGQAGTEPQTNVAQQIAPFLMLLTVLALGLILYFAIDLSSDIGEARAKNDYNGAAKATVQFTHSTTVNFAGETNTNSDGPFTGSFRVLVIGDNFVYLAPSREKCECPEDLKPDNVIPPPYAVPVADIVSIAYNQD